jgi:ABC-2 type transport system ATP-binding protein
MDQIIEVDGLCKSYGTHKALDGVGFSVRRGEVFALLGPNGAGKTTILEILEGIRKADRGSIRVSGIDALAQPDRVLRLLGVQLQTQGLPQAMTTIEALTFFSLYRGRKPNLGLLDRFGLAEKRNAPFQSLSMGLQRRLMLALALAHDPEILILDEPTAALDVESRNTLHEIIREERGRGKTILLASHDMAEVEKLADRALVLVRGRVAALGSPRQLTSQGDRLVRFSLLTRDGSLALSPPALPGARAVEVDAEGYLKLRVADPTLALRSLLAALDDAKDEILDLRVERPSLEERFLELAKSEGETK